MNIISMTSQEFNQNMGKAKYATASGPVFITDGGKPTHELMSIQDYQQITEEHASIVELLAMPEAIDIEFVAPRLDKLFLIF